MKLIPGFSRLAVACVAAWALMAGSQDATAPKAHGIVLANIDHSVKPGDDFYQYANGEWLKRTEIPADRAEVDVFSRLADLSNKRTADLIAEIAKSNPAASSSSRKVADLYNSYMDEAAIEAKGLAPLRPHLDAIAAIRNQQELARSLGETLRADVDALNNTNFHTPNLFGLWVAPGFNEVEHYTAYLMQGGLGLPDREYYISDSAAQRDIREKYKAHVSLMLKMAGFNDTDARAARILELEHAIAEKHISLAENDDIHKANNTWSQDDFAAKAPGLDWPEYFRAAGLSKQKTFIVWQPTAFTAESALVASTALDTWKDWLAYHLIEAQAFGLTRAFSDE